MKNRVLHDILNAGAGEGLYSQELLRCKGLVRLVEMDPAYATLPRMTTDPRQVVVAAPLTAIPLASESIDLVVCTEVLEHVQNDAAALYELSRVMKPGGWLLLSTPTLPAEFDPMHVREGYAATVLAEMLGSQGLEVMRVDYCMYAIYRRLLRAFRQHSRLPLNLVRLAVVLDRCTRWGPPMDMVVLARRSMPASDTEPRTAVDATMASAKRDQTPPAQR
jgi:SAM-dependent methyltransferase